MSARNGQKGPQVDHAEHARLASHWPIFHRFTDLVWVGLCVTAAVFMKSYHGGPSRPDGCPCSTPRSALEAEHAPRTETRRARPDVLHAEHKPQPESPELDPKRLTAHVSYSKDRCARRTVRAE